MARSDKPAPAQPAHRPSRRTHIIDAAIGLFAERGFVDTAISDVAEEANVVATAIYYHFSGKEELYSASVNRVFESISRVVSTARNDEEPHDATNLGAVIDAVWTWIDEHPSEAGLLYVQLPGATRQIATLRQEFEEQHVQRAVGYINDTESRRRVPAARRAVESLTARTLVDLLISIHTARLAEGPLSSYSHSNLRRETHELVQRLVAS